ncbi:hypothetical protein ACN47E_005992 [Coniothyrium glycines]
MNVLFARLIKTFASISADPPKDASTVFMAIISEYVLYIVCLFMGRLLLAYIAILGFRITSLQISARIRLRYLEALFQQPISTLDALPPGQTTAIITITANILQLGISERLSSLLQAIAVMLVALIIGCAFSPQLMLVTASGLVAIAIWYALITPQVTETYSKVQYAEKEAAGAALEVFSCIKIVAACGAEEKMASKYGQLLEQVKTKAQALSPWLALQHSPVIFMTFATFALCFWYAVKLFSSSSFPNVETLVVVLMSVMTMLAHVSAISLPLTAAMNAVAAAGVFFTIIDAPRPSTAGLCGDAVPINHDIVLSGINFAYPARHDVKILKNLSLCVPAGKTTAIVGPSGSGKSTVVALIQRWYELGSSDPLSHYLRNGVIKMGEKDLHEIDLRFWRSQIGYVQQEPFLFNDTIYKNVEFGLVGTQWENAPFESKRRMIMRACKEAYVDEFIRSLPQGYSTNVGERGSHFSGGQRQRIAIARAIVRQPKILIFDEATSALDVNSERIVQNALDRVARNRTTIVIAHRLSTIKHADHIVVVAQGEVIQQGDHKTLLSDEQGAYWKLINAQQLSMERVDPSKSRASTVRLVQTYGKGSVNMEHKSSVEGSSYETLAATATTVADKVGKSAIVGQNNFFYSLGLLLREQKHSHCAYAVIFVSAITAATSSPLQAYLFSRLIASFADLDRLKSSTSFLCSMLFVVALGVGLSYFVLGWVSNNISFQTVAIYRKEYFRNIITKRISFFDRSENAVGLLTTRLATDPAQLQQLLGMNMAMALISIFGLLGCIMIAFIFSWKYALVVIVSSLPIILAGGWYRVRYEIIFEARNNKIFAESAQFATEAIGAMRTVASLTLERTICNSYDALLQSHISKSWREARLSCLSFAASDSLVLLCMAFALWYGGTLLAHGELNSFTFLVIYLAIIQGTLQAGQWLSFGPNLAQVSAATERIQHMRLGDVQTQRAASFQSQDTHRWRLPPTMLWFGADIHFQDIRFTYPTRHLPSLRNFSLAVHHGQFAAIVGGSGSGKTTVIALLQRFYDPDHGSILYNGDNIQNIPLQVLRRRMSIVMQEPYLFRGTIRENVLLGVEDHEIDESVLHQACREAGIHDFIMSLPQGYNTDAGTGGIALSGGQKQRISIARALIRNPAVLLLDEATSNLDSESEKEIQEVFERTGKGRTMIVVAHRLATIQRADVIFVMDQGRVAEYGNHATLLVRKGIYWKMCHGQNLNAC